MSRDKRRLSEEERALWGAVAKSIKRRAREVTSNPAADPPAAAKNGPTGLVRRAPPASSPPPLSKPPPSNRANEKRVRRGKLAVGASLDLHGHTQASGREALRRFLQRAHADGERVVVVITGVGRGGGGVLKQSLPEWLASPELRDIVSGFAPAHRTHGGAGAAYVFLRRAFSNP
ncbi:MAG: Smr/MutS family protein [Hyphomonadaceae bacterium]|nr:Smr/MutS family protein [Hyphomonadaceae bacterium]